MPKREEIYQAIDNERDYQDQTWRDADKHSYFAHHILILETKISRLRGKWYDSPCAEIDRDLKNELVKIAAIAVRALEEVK